MSEGIIKNLSKLLGIFKGAYKNYKKGLVTLTFLGILESLLEAVGVTMLIPIFALITDSDTTENDFISKAIQDFFSAFNFNFTIENLLLLVLFLFIVKFIIISFAHYAKADVMTKYQENTMKELFNRMADASWYYLVKQRIGHLENALFVEVEYGRKILIIVSSSVVFATSVLIYAIVAFTISPAITISTLLFGLVVLLLFKRSVFKIKKDSSEVNAYNKKVAHYVTERIIGMKTIKAIDVAEKIKKDAGLFFHKLRIFRKRVIFRKKFTGAIYEPLSVLYILIVFYIFQLQPDFNIASFAVIIFLIQRIFQYTRQVQGMIYNIGESVPFLKNMLSQINNAIEHKEANLGKEEFSFQRELRFDQVSFSYTPEKIALEDINFTVSKGSMLGIIGPSGAGKTSVTDLILRLLSPTSGSITIDGEDINNINLRDWRKNVGYVSQDIFLIDGTFAENIRFYDKNITDEEVEEAAKMANIYQFISEKKDGFASHVGERGLALSVGQRQRIAIARVLARKPQLLVMDEATSALDNESAESIRTVIKNLKGKVTIISIAHKLSSIIDCDVILALQDGKVLEVDKPENLMKEQDSYFSRLQSLEG